MEGFYNSSFWEKVEKNQETARKNGGIPEIAFRGGDLFIETRLSIRLLLHVDSRIDVSVLF